MRTWLLAGMLLGCGGSAPPRATPPPPQPERVAVAGDPCDGGEVHGGDEAGGAVRGDDAGAGGAGRSPVADVPSPVEAEPTGGSAGRGPARRAKSPRVTLAQPRVTGARDRQTIRRVVHARIDELAHCFAGDFSVRLRVDFTIARDGRVTAVKADAGTEALRDCVTGVFAQLVFPPADEVVTVSYPVGIHAAGQ